MKKSILSVVVISSLLIGTNGSVVQAAECTQLNSDDLFKVPNSSSVYLINQVGERMYFPNSEVYHTWYSDFNGVVEIPETCVDNYPAPSKAPYGVNYRSGSRLIKKDNSSEVYAVSPGNVIKKIKDEDTAKTLYGEEWSKLVRDVVDSFWVNYEDSNEEVNGSAPHDGMIVKSESEQNAYFVKDGELHELGLENDLNEVYKNDLHVLSDDVINGLNKNMVMFNSRVINRNPDQYEGFEFEDEINETNNTESNGNLENNNDSPNMGNDDSGDLENNIN